MRLSKLQLNCLARIADGEEVERTFHTWTTTSLEKRGLASGFGTSGGPRITAKGRTQLLRNFLADELLRVTWVLPERGSDVRRRLLRATAHELGIMSKFWGIQVPEALEGA